MNDTPAMRIWFGMNFGAVLKLVNYGQKPQICVHTTSTFVLAFNILKIKVQNPPASNFRCFLLLLKIRWFALELDWLFIIFSFSTLESVVDPSVSCTVVCHWVLNILSPIMPVWPTRIFALMSFGMTRFRFIFPFYLGLLPLAPHINREQISMSRSEHFLSSLSNFFLDISFFCCHFQLLFRQEMYLSKLRTYLSKLQKLLLS